MYTHTHTHTHHEHHIIYVYHIHTQIHTQYTRTPTDVTHSGSFRGCINLFAYLLQPSAFLFTAHCVFCLESPPVLSADSTEECSKKANFRWGWEGWQSRTQCQVWVLYSYGFGRTYGSGYAAGPGAYTIIIVVHIFIQFFQYRVMKWKVATTWKKKDWSDLLASFRSTV